MSDEKKQPAPQPLPKCEKCGKIVLKCTCQDNAVEK